MDNLPPYAAPPRIWVTFFSTYEGESDLLISQQRGDVFTAAREYEATIEAEFRVTNCGNFDETDYDAKYYRKDVLNHAIDYALNRNAELVIATHDRLTWSELYAISDATAKRYLCVKILDLLGGDYSNPVYLGFTVGVASSQVKCPNRRPADPPAAPPSRAELIEMAKAIQRQAHGEKVLQSVIAADAAPLTPAEMAKAIAGLQQQAHVAAPLDGLDTSKNPADDGTAAVEADAQPAAKECKIDGEARIERIRREFGEIFAFSGEEELRRYDMRILLIKIFGYNSIRADFLISFAAKVGIIKKNGIRHRAPYVLVEQKAATAEKETADRSASWRKYFGEIFSAAGVDALQYSQLVKLLKVKHGYSSTAAEKKN